MRQVETLPRSRLSESWLRRYDLACLGFRFDVARGLWYRGHRWLTDEEVDDWPDWPRAVQGWMATKP
jgi:hypothetical protein